MSRIDINAKRDFKQIIKWILNKYGIIFILIAGCLLLTILNQNFLRVKNLINVVRQVAVTGIIGMGVTFCIVTAGTDLSSGSVVGLVGILSAMATVRGVSLPLALLFASAIGTLTGLVNGIIIVKGNIAPFIATLGMMTAARGAALLCSNGKPISLSSEAFKFIGQGSIIGIPIPVIIFTIMGLITHVILSKFRFGRHVYAVGGNAQAAITCGINKDRVLIMVYTLAGFMTSIAGIILTARVGSGQPNSGLNYEFEAITGAVIGGTSFNGGVGRISGTMIGALIIGVLNNGMDLLGISPYWQQVVKGVIIISAVVLDARRNRNYA
jgi:inositol transport system permease protein